MDSPESTQMQNMVERIVWRLLYGRCHSEDKKEITSQVAVADSNGQAVCENRITVWKLAGPVWQP